jgi:ribose transport system permease protein
VRPALGRRGESIWVRRLGLLVIWAAMVAAFGWLRPESFLSAGTLGAILSSQAPLLVLALGLLPALSCRTLDLSAPAALGLADTLVGELNVVLHWPLWATVLTVLGVGGSCGLLNALLIAVLGVDPIVITLGTGTLFSGIALGVNIVPTSGISPWLVEATRRQVLGVQLVFYLALLLTAATWYFFTHRPAGRQLYFVGAGPEVAALSGINVMRYRAGALVYAGVVAALAGIVLAGTLGSSDPTIGPGYLLPVFASIFLGATTITPGRFNAWGTLIAVYFLTTGVTGLELLGFSGWVNQVFYGGCLVAAATTSHLLATAVD